MAPPPDHGRRPVPGAPPNRAIRLLAAYLSFVALACTGAPLFVHPDVNVGLALAQIPVALWAVRRRSREADPTDHSGHADAGTAREEPWS